MEFVLVPIAFFAWMSLRSWIRHQRRMALHKERMAMLEKGMELPPPEQEIRQAKGGIQRMLLLAGLCWIAAGVAVFVTLSAMLAHSAGPAGILREGIEWIALAPAGIGMAHLLVYLIGSRADR